MSISQDFGEAVEARRSESAGGRGMYPGDPWVTYTLRPDEARALAAILRHETHDAGFTADAACLDAAADWADRVDEDDEGEDEQPILGLVVVVDKDEERRRELWYDRPRGGTVTS